MSVEGLLAQLPPPPAGLTGWPWTEATPVNVYAPAPPAGWPRISIVCPSFRQGRYIEETIRSVLLQNYPAFDFIVIDGGSDDETVAILKKYAPWLAYWESAPDRGQAHALNKGFARATGEIHGWINSDDYYLPGAFAALGQAFRAAPRSLLFGDWCEREGENPILLPHDERPAFAFEVAVGARHLPSHATFWPSAAHQPLAEALQFTLDAELFKRLAAAGLPPRHIPRRLGVFRRHPLAKTSTLEATAKAETAAWSAAQPWHVRWRWAFARRVDRWRMFRRFDRIIAADSLLRRLHNLLVLVRQLGWRETRHYLRRRPALRSGQPAAPVSLLSRHARHPLLCRPGTSDVDAFALIFIEREFRCLDALSSARLIVDCGANVGYASAYLLSRFPDAQLVAIEPDPANFAILAQNLAPYGQRATARQAAVWSAPGALAFAAEPFRDGREWSRHVRAVQPQEAASVTAVDLATVLAETGQTRIDILKIDIEGAEVEVFSRNYERWLAATETLLIELHDERCREVFLRAIAREGFSCLQFGELTVCRRALPRRA